MGGQNHEPRRGLGRQTHGPRVPGEAREVHHEIFVGQGGVEDVVVDEGPGAGEKQRPGIEVDPGAQTAGRPPVQIDQYDRSILKQVDSVVKGSIRRSEERRVGKECRL